jgi:hypothetical protein
LPILVQYVAGTELTRGASPKGETAARDLLTLDRDPSATPEGARRLLAEAGYPSGFGITLQAANHRYV